MVVFGLFPSCILALKIKFLPFGLFPWPLYACYAVPDSCALMLWLAVVGTEELVVSLVNNPCLWQGEEGNTKEG